MNPIAKKMNEFKKFDYLQKKDRTFKMLDMIKEEAPVFQNVLNNLNNLEYIPEYMFDSIYQDILTFSAQLKDEEMHTMIQKMRQRQKQIRATEAQNNSDQNEADRLINLLYV
ncbi:MAG TPA: hypothetical protein PKC14_03550 [Candidatus Absconditabacterales bacterium]|nr:hypothetical protein [Candidatus Absconditabacterales bacterium]